MIRVYRAPIRIDKRRNMDVSTRVDLLRLQPLLRKCRVAV
jgi:hypothetical protein